MKETNIVYLKLTDSKHPLIEKVEKTYVDSFPEEERRDFPLVKDLVDKDDMFNLYVIQREGKYVGFLSAWTFEGFRYVEHFAIDESARNGGIGRQVLKTFMDLSNLPVVLEVELPLEEMAKRRIGFYERLGFRLDNNVYRQPPYRKDNPEIEMRFMSAGNIDLTKDFESVKKEIYKHVYGVACK